MGRVGWLKTFVPYCSSEEDGDISSDEEATSEYQNSDNEFGQDNPGLANLPSRRLDLSRRVTRMPKRFT